jgi:hypothetical protein
MIEVPPTRHAETPDRGHIDHEVLAAGPFDPVPTGVIVYNVKGASDRWHLYRVVES